MAITETQEDERRKRRQTVTLNDFYIKLNGLKDATLKEDGQIWWGIETVK